MMVTNMFRKRLKDIMDARRKIDDNGDGQIVDKKTFLESFKEGHCISADNSSAAYMGYEDTITYKIFYCPIEEFYDKDLDTIEAHRFKDTHKK